MLLGPMFVSLSTFWNPGMAVADTPYCKTLQTKEINPGRNSRLTGSAPLDGGQGCLDLRNWNRSCPSLRPLHLTRTRQ
jgi:hypothetical protein